MKAPTVKFNRVAERRFDHKAALDDFLRYADAMGVKPITAGNQAGIDRGYLSRIIHGKPRHKMSPDKFNRLVQAVKILAAKKTI